MIFLNGHFHKKNTSLLNPDDRGFLLGDGIFETLRVYSGKIFCLKEHWQRCKTAADFLGIPFTLTVEALQQIALELLKENHLLKKDASLRLTITRGSGPRGLMPPEHCQPTILLTASPYIPLKKPALHVYISQIKRNEYSPLANIKSLNYLDNVLAKREALSHHADDAILLNTNNCVASASAANIFIASQNGLLVTPPLKDGVLPGITRQILFKLCKELNISIAEQSITVSELFAAKHVFLTNSLIEILPVHQINDSKITHPIDRWFLSLQKAFSALT